MMVLVKKLIKNAINFHRQSENPKSWHSWGFLARCGELLRIGCCCLIISVQPFAYVVTNHTCCDGNYKCD